jgi:molybdopterin synthase catalytic subunit
MVKIVIRTEPLLPWQELARYEATLPNPQSVGACSAFVGSMRDFNEGDTVTGMVLEHYPGMTERHLERIAQEAGRRWELEDVLLVHRVGELYPTDPIVLVAAWSAHRRDAFEACRYLMEELKSKAPFWKKELLESGTRWVEHNTAGY